MAPLGSHGAPWCHHVTQMAFLGAGRAFLPDSAARSSLGAPRPSAQTTRIRETSRNQRREEFALNLSGASSHF